MIAQAIPVYSAKRTTQSNTSENTKSGNDQAWQEIAKRYNVHDLSSDGIKQLGKELLDKDMLSEMDYMFFTLIADGPQSVYPAEQSSTHVAPPADVLGYYESSVKAMEAFGGYDVQYDMRIRDTLRKLDILRNNP